MEPLRKNLSSIEKLELSRPTMRHLAELLTASQSYDHWSRKFRSSVLLECSSPPSLTRHLMLMAECVAHLISLGQKPIDSVPVKMLSDLDLTSKTYHLEAEVRTSSNCQILGLCSSLIPDARSSTLTSLLLTYELSFGSQTNEK